jgi:hypothetical protein
LASWRPQYRHGLRLWLPTMQRTVARHTTWHRSQPRKGHIHPGHELTRHVTKLDRIGDAVREFNGRAGALEERYAIVSRRLDSIELRVARIERRF